jgi:hypothetical protein
VLRTTSRPLRSDARTPLLYADARAPGSLLTWSIGRDNYLLASHTRPVGDCTVQDAGMAPRLVPAPNGRLWRYITWGNLTGWVSDVMLKRA